MNNMPHIDIRSSKVLGPTERSDIQQGICEIISLIPGKTPANTVICISDGCSMYKDGNAIEGIFVDVRLFKESPEESKKAFAEKLFALTECITGIPKQYIQLNFIELPVWAANGQYLT